MRKSAFNQIILFLLIFPLQISTIFSQQFGAVPLKECWKIENEAIIGLKIASDNEVELFLSNSDGLIEAINKLTGEIIWKTEIGGELYPQILNDSQKLYIVSKNANGENEEIKETKEISDEKKSTLLTVRALSISTGITNWQKPLNKIAGEEIFFLENAEQLFLLTRSGKFTALSKAQGEILSEAQLDARITALPFLYAGKIYLGTSEKKIETISIPDGKKQTLLDLPGIPKSIYINGNGNLYTGDAAGNLLAMDIQRNSVKWKNWTGAEITNITRVDRGLLVTSFDNYVYLLSEKNGKRLWKTRLSGRSMGTPLIKDNVAVFSTFGGTDAVFIELKKGKSINRILIQEQNYFVNNPQSAGDLIFFPTHRGVFAYTAAVNCPDKK
jgi:outer membrane protein assembly factor BamB